MIKIKLDEYLSINTRVLFNMYDDVTKKHATKMAEITEKLSLEMKTPDNEKNRLIKGALFHDIGKILINDSIISKTSALTNTEKEIIKEHTEIGYKMCVQYDELKDCSEMARYHHEKINGTGYQKLNGDQIPISAKIISVVDIYEALTAERSYKKPLPFNEVRNILLSEANIGNIDKDIVNSLLKVAERDIIQETTQNFSNEIPFIKNLSKDTILAIHDLSITHGINTMNDIKNLYKSLVKELNDQCSSTTKDVFTIVNEVMSEIKLAKLNEMSKSCETTKSKIKTEEFER